MRLPSYLLAFGAVLHFAAANVEKTIFLGPERITIPNQKPTIVDLGLDSFATEDIWSLRTHVSAQFPTEAKPKGEAYWAVLQDLVPGQRYEVRICWAATVSFPSPELSPSQEQWLRSDNS
jgi:hypothetical protein